MGHATLAGPCEWCGGPQAWTVIRGYVYVSCDLGCLPIPGLGLDPPPDSPELIEPDARVLMGTKGRGGVVPREGGDTNLSGELAEWPGEPPRAFLDLMWEGTSYGEK